MITSHVVFFIKLTPLRIQSHKTDDTETSSQFHHYLACKNIRGLEKTLLGKSSIFNFILNKVLLRIRKLEPLIQ